MATCVSPSDDPALTVKEFTGNHEVLSLVGTLGPDGAHLHTSLSDSSGAVVGGHLMCATIFTTAEVIVHELHGTRFKRTMDSATGFKELEVVRIP